MNHNATQALLEQLYDRYDRLDFIADDPVSIPHRYSRREDREIAGLLAATIAWGSRPVIVRNARRMMQLMDDDPYRFTMEASDAEMLPLRSFVHRTFNGDDLCAFIYLLRDLCQDEGGVGEFFEREYARCGDMREVLSAFRLRFFAPSHPARCGKHLSSIDRGATCKRLNMYLRWMVRHDSRGVDFGLWKGIPPSALYLPLDLHSGRMSRALGLLSRTQNDWRAVEEVTIALRHFDSHDPVKYDFALFGAGIDGFLDNNS